MKKRIYLSPPSHSDLESKFVQEAIESNWLSSQGSFIDDFESSLSDFHNSPALLTNSGTSALHLALIVAGVSENDLVLCSNFTFAASAFPVLYQKAKPVFLGSEIDSWNVSLEIIQKAIHSLPKKPKAFIYTYVYGMPGPIEAIAGFCAENGIVLIEDAAEALGSEVKKQKAGTIGDFGILSFNGNKIITTSAGGALFAKKPEHISKARKIASQAKENSLFYNHHSVGYNYLQSNLLAAVGRAQFENISARIAHRRTIFNRYKSAFETIEGILFQKENTDSFSNFWLSSFIFPKGSNHLIRENLEKENIESRYLFHPLTSNKVFEDCTYFGNKEELEWFENGLSLPSGYNLTLEDQKRIINIVKDSL